MNTFYFNTGVRLPTVCHAKGAIDSGNGVFVIPFECEAPKGSVLKFCSDHLDRSEGKAYPIKQPSNMLSKYAYFN